MVRFFEEKTRHALCSSFVGSKKQLFYRTLCCATWLLKKERSCLVFGWKVRKPPMVLFTAVYEERRIFLWISLHSPSNVVFFRKNRDPGSLLGTVKQGRKWRVIIKNIWSLDHQKQGHKTIVWHCIWYSSLLISMKQNGNFQRYRCMCRDSTFVSRFSQFFPFLCPLEFILQTVFYSAW